MTQETLAPEQGRGQPRLSERLAQLDRLAADLVAVHTPVGVAEATIKRAASALGATGGLLAVLPDGADALEVMATAGYPPEFLERWRHVPLDSPLLLATAARTRRTVALPALDPGSDGGDALPPDAAVPDGRAAVAVPMRVGDRVHGALTLTFTDAPAFNPDDEALLLSMGTHAALSLERTRLAEGERAARDRLAFLVDASVLLAGSLDVEGTLDRLVHMVVPRLADWCAVHLLSEDDELLEAAVHHRDSDGLDTLLAVLHAMPIDLGMPFGAGAVIAGGATQLFPSVPDEVLVALARGDAELLRAMRALPLRTGLIVPLSAHDRTIGAFTMAREHGGPYTADQVDLAEILGRRAGLAVDNARSHEEARAALAARDREAARAELESQRLTALLDQLPVGVILVEAPSGRIVKRNPAVDAIFKEPWGDAEEVGDFGAGRTYRMDGTPLPADELPLARAVRHGETVRDERLELRWSDGTASILEINAGPVRDPAGRIFAGVAAFTDVTSRTAAERELAAAARRNAELAHTLQASLLPPGLPVIPGLELAAAYLPVGSGVEVGGDFYDVFPAGRDEEWAVAIGDVCGKGAEAAGITALARHTLQAGSVRARRPSVLLGLLNETMLRQETARPFITAVFGVLRPVPEGGVTGTIAVGGHPLPYVLRADGSVEALGAPGSLVGVLDEAEFHDVGFRLAPGDALVLYTDGATEARAGEEQFGEERLLATLVAAHGNDAEGIVTSVVEAIRSFQSGSPRDDLALLVVRAAA